MYIHTTIPVGKSEAVFVPYQAVLKLTGSNERFIFVNEDGFAKRVAVTLGDRSNNLVEIISEENLVGKELVVEGQSRLIDGIGLEIIGEEQLSPLAVDSIAKDTIKK